jgi:hypothetical protein
MVNTLTAGSAIGSSPFNDNSTIDKRFQNPTEEATAPLCFDCKERNATLVAASGNLLCNKCYSLTDIDPSLGVVVWGMDDDVPFTHQPIRIDIAEPVKAFEVAEYIVSKWGKAFATEVAGEVSRWW